MTQLTKEYFDQKLTQQTEQLQSYAAEQNQQLALMVKKGFDSVDAQLAEIRDQLDVRKDVEDLKLQMQEIRHALKLDS
jgi:hypothetical protein